MKKKILSLLLICAMLMALVPSVSAAEVVVSGKCGRKQGQKFNTETMQWEDIYDNVNYFLYSDGNFVISGEGELEYYSFCGDDRIVTLTIGEGITNLNESFLGCKSLVSVNVPASVAELEPDGWVDGNDYSSACQYCNEFSGCSSLKQIKISSDNQKFKVLNNVVYSKDETKLVFYPAGKTQTSYEIPKNVTIIGSGAFDDCKKLKTLLIPDTVSEIYSNAFAGCVSLESISFPRAMNYIPCGLHNANFKKIFIPSTVQILGDSVLDNIYSLTDELPEVYYEGTEQQWKNMDLRVCDTRSEGLLKATIHYNATGLPSQSPAPVSTPIPTPKPTPVPKHFAVSDSRVTNTADTAQTATIITAQYSGNRLTDVTSQEITFAANEAKTFTVPTGGKLFVWDSISGMRPLTK